MWWLMHHFQAHVEDIKKTHLRELMSDAKRCQSLSAYDTCFVFMFGSLKIKDGALCRMVMNLDFISS